jgi:hypothetical protein
MLAAGTEQDVIKAKEQYPSIDASAFRKTAYDALAQIRI